MTIHQPVPPSRPTGPGPTEKFIDPVNTASGSPRAVVNFNRLKILWFNAGTLCNLECTGCYIESSPKNDRLDYLTAAEVASYLDEIERTGLNTWEIGFTGGEPFMNPQIINMMMDCLSRGFEVLVLTNGMRPMMNLNTALLNLRQQHEDRLTLRVSLDHYTKTRHEELRGPRSWDITVQGLKWLTEQGFQLHVAGRTIWNEDEATVRMGYARLFCELGLAINAHDPVALLLFPEMDEVAPVPEITTSCWSLRNVDPNALMCANSRMVVKHKGADRPTVQACTLLPYDRRFDLGNTLEAACAGPVALNHPHCAKFCVLGGGACSARD